MVTMGSEKDLRHPEIGKLVEKYFKGIASVPTENRCRILRLVENITLARPQSAIARNPCMARVRHRLNEL